jgi:hypothetical protein
VLVGLLLYAVRWMEGWLYRHLFKVGWLLSHNLQATTIFFYLFFLPGIVVHEATMWLVAGAFNVRADRSLTWPAEQSEARLKLDFVKISKKANRLSLVVIGLSPLVTGLTALWLILFGVLQVNVAAAQYSGDASTLPALAQQVVRAPDFWLWFYVAFTIANTMFPGQVKALSGWKPIVWGVLAFIGFLMVLGLGDVVLGRALRGPLRDGALLLSALLGCILAFDLIVTLVLRVIETLVEAVGGSSATYHNGKLIALTRQQVKAQRAAEKLKAEKAAKAQAEAPPGRFRTIYDLPLPIPPAPGKLETVTVTVEKPVQPALGGGTPPLAASPPSPGPASAAAGATDSAPLED